MDIVIYWYKVDIAILPYWNVSVLTEIELLISYVGIYWHIYIHIYTYIYIYIDIHWYKLIYTFFICWYTDILTNWSTDILKYWDAEILIFGYIDILIYWYNDRLIQTEI